MARLASLLALLLLACSDAGASDPAQSPGGAGTGGSAGASGGAAGSGQGGAGAAGDPGGSGGSGGSAGPERAGPLKEAKALVTVRGKGWNSPAGSLALWRWEGGWKQQGSDIPVMIGKSGLGWGRGLHGEGALPAAPGPQKKEGDGRSPAGLFRIGKSYGYAASAPEGTQAAYEAMTPTLQCIEDTKSAFYNQIVDKALTTPDWSSTDLLKRADGLYEFILFVEQNYNPAVPGRGSCILFHVWSGPTVPTAGCTSMERDQLEWVVKSLAPDGNLLVQLPDEAYTALAAEWELP